MIINAAQLCELLQGELIGDGETKIYGPSQIDKGIPGTVTFLANPKYEEYAYSTLASVLIVSKDFLPKEPLKPSLIKVDDVYGAMMFLVDRFSKNGTPQPGISEYAVLPKDFNVAEDISIGAFTVVEKDTTIGARTILYPQVFIGHDTQIGKDVII